MMMVVMVVVVVVVMVEMSAFMARNSINAHCAERERERERRGEQTNKQNKNTLKGKTRQTDIEGHEREKHSYENLNTEYQ